MPRFGELAAEGKLEWIRREFEPTDLDGNFIVIAATDVPEVNAAVYREAVERRHSLQQRGRYSQLRFLLRIGCAAAAICRLRSRRPEKAPLLRNGCGARSTSSCRQDLGPWLAQLGNLRREVLATHPRAKDASCCCTSWPSARSAIHRPALLASWRERTQAAQRGKVFLVGAGPGDPDLLTVKALRLIESADVILHDDLVPQRDSRSRAPRQNRQCRQTLRQKNITQEEINALMIDHARAESQCGPAQERRPAVFGRAAEEIAALTAAEVPFEIVPGVTAASAAAAAVGFR